MNTLDFHFTDRARESADASHFGLLVAQDLDTTALGAALKPVRKTTQRTLDGTPPDILNNLQAFERFFKAHNHAFPLLSQREHLRKAGIPSSNPLVTLLLLAELSTGVLIGIQDAGAIRGTLQYDVLSSSDSFEGMRGRVTCYPGEIVLRDADGVIASLFQGPDRRTQLHPGSRDIAAFAFGVPGMDCSITMNAMKLIGDLIGGSAKNVEHATYSPGGRA